MKYFSSLPKVTFSSSIGDFKVSSFFSYYEFDENQMDITTTQVDNKTTLTELSHTIYQDNNSMWLFLLANRTTDPFKLLAENSTLYSDRIEDNITLGLNLSGVPSSIYVNPSGSILAPYSLTGGSAWQYSSVGNFDLDGAFTVVDSTDYYNAKMSIKEQKNGNPFIIEGSTVDNVIVIENGDTYSTDGNVYDTKNKVATINDIVYIVQSDSGTIDTGDTNYPNTEALIAPPDPAYQNSGATTAVSNYTAVATASKIINVIVPTSVSSLLNRLQTFSY